MFFPFDYWRVRVFAIMLFTFSNTILFSQKTDHLLDSTTLKTVVIQATRTGEKSPVPHTNLSQSYIKEANQAQDIPYLLSSVLSLVENSDAGAGVGYTGIRIRGSDPTRINVTINGIPLNDAESQGMYWVDLPDLAASAAEIQVQRGVGSSTNGAGAFGATVNIDLSRVNPEPTAVITNGFGSLGTRKHTIQLGTGLIDNKIAFSGRLSQIKSDGYVDRASADLRSFHLTGAYVGERQSLQFHMLSGHEVTYQAWNGLPAQFLDNEQLRTYNSAGTEKPGSPYEDEVDDYTQRYYLAHYNFLLSNSLNLQINGHYTRGFGFYEQYKADQEYEDYGLANPVIEGNTVTQTDLVRRRWLDNHFYGGTFALKWGPSVNPPFFLKAPEFLLGGGFSKYDGKHFGEVIWADQGISKNERYYDNDATKYDGNLFLKMELHFKKGLSTFLDLQHRYVNYQFLGFDQNQDQVTQTATLNFFNPKLGLYWDFHSNYSAYSFFGIGHREPNRDDYTQSTPASRPQPEKLSDWETGLKMNYPRLTGTLNLFYMNYKNQLVLDGQINDVGAYIRTNVPKSYRTGIEMEVAWQLLQNIRISGNVAISRNKVREFVEYRDNWDTGEQESISYKNSDLAFSPDVISRTEIQWDVLPSNSRQSLSVVLSGKYVGKQFLDNTSNEATILPAYFFTDVRFNYDIVNFLGRQLSVIFSINNVLDAKYFTNGWVYRYSSGSYDDRPFNPYTRLEGNGVYHQAGYFPQAGRNFMGTLRLEF